MRVATQLAEAMRRKLGQGVADTIIAIGLVLAMTLVWAFVVQVTVWLGIPQPLGTYIAVGLVFGSFTLWWVWPAVEFAFMASQVMWPVVLICSLIGAFIDAWKGGLWGALAGIVLATVIAFFLRGRSYRRP